MIKNFYCDLFSKYCEFIIILNKIMEAKDIFQIRTDLKLTQEFFGNLIGVSKNTIYNWENGSKIPDSKIKMLKSFIQTGNEKTEALEQNVKILNLLNEPTETYMQAEAISIDFSEMNIMMVPLVSAYCYAGYLNGFGDQEYLEELPKVSWADDKEHRGEYLCFEVKGDSMDDGTTESILEGDLLLCRNVRRDFWQSKLHISKWDFVIVHKEKGILVKRIVEHNVEKGLLTLHSLNEYYDDCVVHLKDIAKILNVVDLKRKHKRR